MNHAPLLVWVIIAMVIAWLIMIVALQKRLKSNHIEKYKEMGEPSFFYNNSIKSSFATIKFLFKREHKNFNDKALSILSDGMLIFLTVYAILLIGLFILEFINVHINAKSRQVIRFAHWYTT